MPEGQPAVEPLADLVGQAGDTGWILSVDVEEWYHTCLVPEYVHPRGRPALAEDLDTWLGEWPARWADQGRFATFFVLGEVARRLPGRVRQLSTLGHEVASHGALHLRVDELAVGEFVRSAADSRRYLEDLIGGPVLGYRAPEWSMRRLANPRIRGLVEAGFHYDSSLHRAWGVGARSNPAGPSLLRWSDGVTLLEVPPGLLFGRLRVPLGGWPVRVAPESVTRRTWVRARAAAGVAVAVVHPWELTDRPCPGDLSGWARFVHDAGRLGFAPKFERLLGTEPWDSITRSLQSVLPSR